MTNSTKKTAFSWDEKTTAKAIELYNAEVESAGLEVANTTKALNKIAEAIGAKSGQAVRSKLSVEKVYTKIDVTPTGSVKNKPTKVSLVRNLEAVLGLKRDTLETLDKANVGDLETLTAAILEMGTVEAVTAAYEALQDDLVSKLAEETENAEVNAA
jgi:hypothetical protein